MSSPYREIFPNANLSQYLPNTDVDFKITIPGEDLELGSLELVGECAVYQTGSTAIAAGTDIQYDGLAGYHGFIRDIQTSTTGQGKIETLQNYPRLVKMRALATLDLNKVGMSSVLATEGRFPDSKMTTEYLRGINPAARAAADIPFLPFALKPEFCLNSVRTGLNGDVVKQINLRFRLQSNQNFLFGEAWDNLAPNYVLRKLRLRYRALPQNPDSPSAPVNLITYSNNDVGSIQSTVQNFSSSVEGLVSAMHMSFIKTADEDNSVRNYLACQPPLGVPTGESNTEQSYGLERFEVAINDVDTALIGWTLEFRNEIIMNGLRSFDVHYPRYNQLLNLMSQQLDPDGYVGGIPFGQPLQLSGGKFGTEYQTAISSSADYTTTYLYYRTITAVA